MAIGDITGTIASHEFDPGWTNTPDIIHIAGNIYAIAYEGNFNDGWITTVSISDDGLTLSTIASHEFDPVDGWEPDIIHVAGNIYAIVYEGPNMDGWLKTVSISDDGLTMSTVASYEFAPVNATQPNIIHVAGNIYAIAHYGIAGVGTLTTVSISDDGLTLGAVASHTFDAGDGWDPKIIHVAGNIYAIAYTGPDSDGWLKTVSISDDGLTLSTIASHEFDTADGRWADIIHIAGNIYAIAYRGPDLDGWLKTVSISDDGLTLSTIASHEFDTAETRHPDIIHIAGDVYAIAYSGLDYDGWLKTVSISDDGLTMSTIASYEFDPVEGWWPDIIHIAGDVYAIVYRGPGIKGWLKTVGIVSAEAAAARHRFTGGLMHRSIH